jgi:WhiB family redox-sensing transcriptional regulator
MWQFQGHCKPEDDKIFFSELPSKVTKAKAICSTCPVQKQCLDFAISNNIEEGIFGGFTFDERKSLVSVA